jgi:hypothetical protein
MLKKSNESTFLRNWHLKLLILGGIVMPTVTATGAYYDLKAKLVATQTQNQESITKLELKSVESFAGKEDIKAIRDEVSAMHDDVTSLKVYVTRKLK